MEILLHLYRLRRPAPCRERPPAAPHPAVPVIRGAESRMGLIPGSGAARPDLHERIKRVLLPRYIWGDALAIYYSHLYRGAYVLSYLLSAVAVFIALGAVFIHEDQQAQPR